MYRRRMLGADVPVTTVPWWTYGALIGVGALLGYFAGRSSS